MFRRTKVVGDVPSRERERELGSKAIRSLLRMYRYAGGGGKV